MFARYNYSAGATVANIMADVCAILTGTTDKATLSASCDQTNTYIYNTYTDASWIMHDSAAGTNQVVLKGARHDDPTNYEYAMLDFNSVASKFGIRIYETWNETTHAGTNLCYTAAGAALTTYYQRINTTSGGSIIIYAYEGRCMLFQGNTSTGIGDDTNKAWIGCAQRTRISPWDTVAAGYPLSSVICGYSMFAGLSDVLPLCRSKNPSGGDYTSSTSAGLKTTGHGLRSDKPPVTTVYYAAVQKMPDGAGGYYAPLVNLGAANPQAGHLGGSFSDVCDFWLSVQYPLNLDEMTLNGKTYVFLANTVNAQSTSTGTSNLAVPKG